MSIDQCDITEKVVPLDATPERLDVVTARFMHLSRSHAARLIRTGCATVDGEDVNLPAKIVKPGSKITLDIIKIKGEGKSPKTGRFNIRPLYSDEHLAVFDKPAGVTVHPGAGKEDFVLSDVISALFPNASEVGSPGRPGIVHRLDKNTSGLIVTALTNDAYEVLTDLIKRRMVKRQYKALVIGQPDPAFGIVDAAIGRHPVNRTKQALLPTGKPARTHYKVEEVMGDYALLRLELETGRMHQIRVHMASIGHPIAGDDTYGGRRSRFPGLSRQFLHASDLSFTHPLEGCSMHFTSDLPPDLRSSLEYARSRVLV